MKAISAATMSLIATATKAMAATEANGSEGMGMLAMFFIGFGVLVVLFQFVPGIMLLTGIVKGLFTRKTEEHEEAGKSKL
jgi:hypothetical protein